MSTRAELEREVEKLRAEVARLRRKSPTLPAGVQASLQGILDSTTATIALLDGAGRIVAVNESWRRFGRQNGASSVTVEGVGLDYLEVCRRAAGDAVARRVLAGLERVLAGREGSFHDEYPCHSSTVERWFTVDVTRPRGEAGAVVTHVDVTAQTQVAQRLAQAQSELARQVEARTRELTAANRELRASEQKLRTVLAAHPDLVFRLRRDGRFLGLHAGDPSLLAVPPEQTVGANVRDLGLPPEFVEQVLAAIDEALASQELCSIEYDLEVPRGRRHFEGRLVPYAEGEVLAIVRDLTASHRARELVAREREQARRYLDLAGVVMLALDRSGRVTLINRRGCQVLGGAEEEILGRDWFETFIPPRDRRRMRRRFTGAMAGRRRLAEHHENPILTLGGEERLIFWHNTLLHDAQGNVTGTLSSGEDVTDQRRAEEALRESHDLLQGVVEGTVDSIFVKDLEGRYLVMNAAGAAVLGLPASEIVSRRDAELLPPRALATVQAADRAVLETGEPQASEDVLEVEGETRIYVTTRAPLRDKAGAIRGVIGVSKDVTAMRRTEEVNRRLREASLTDSLTGLRNRRYLSAFIHQDVSLVDREYRYLGRDGGERTPPPDQLFLMIDLDGLKLINDLHGHEIGDQVLVELGRLLGGACRDSDTVIRWGGDEFLVVGRHADQAAAEVLAERIRDTVEGTPVELENRQIVRLTCSIGFAFYPFVPSAPQALSWEQVLSLADRALLIAKRSGRNAWVGFLGLDGSPDLLPRLKGDLRGLVAGGKVVIRSSLPAGQLVLGGPTSSPLSAAPPGGA